MVLIAVGSVKGSPGVTSAALAMAACWPGVGGVATSANRGAGAVVVEADPAGGDLAARFGLPRSPGLAELASDTRTPAAAIAAARSPEDAVTVIGPYARRLPELGARVVLGPSASQMGPALQLLAGSGLLGFVADHVDLIVDVGRLDRQSPALPLAYSADVLLVVTRGWPDGLDAVTSRRSWLLAPPGMRAQVQLVVTGDLPYPVKEIATAVGVPVAGHLPDDRDAAAVLSGRVKPGRGWTRLPLPRAARSLAGHLASSEFGGQLPAQVAGGRGA